MRERNKRQSTDTTTNGKGREEINLLMELPDKEKYYRMPLDRLKGEKYAAVDAWQKKISADKAIREAIFKDQTGRAATWEESQSLFEDALRYMTPEIGDLIFIQLEIEKIYIERLKGEVEAILSRESKADKVKGIIDLFGLILGPKDNITADASIYYKETGEVLPAFILPESFRRGKQGLINTLHDPDDAPAASLFIMDNWKAVISELEKRDKEKKSREAYGYARGGKITDAMMLIHRAEKPEDKDVDIGEISLGGVKITIGHEKGEIANEQQQGTLPGFSSIQDLLSPKLQQSVLYMLKCLHDGGVKAGRIEGPVSDFATKRGISERDAREQLREAMAILRNARLSKTAGTEGEFENVYMFGGTERIINGKFFFSFNPDFLRRYFEQPAIPFALKLFEINTQYNPYSPALGWKMLSHFNMNKADNNANRISVRKLLDVCENFGMPTYEAVMETDRAVGRRIIEPFERDMNELEERQVLFWRYADRGKNEAKEIPTTYQDFIGKIIIFELLNYPDPTKQIEEIEANRARRRRAKDRTDLKRLEKQQEKKGNNS